MFPNTPPVSPGKDRGAAIGPASRYGLIKTVIAGWSCFRASVANYVNLNFISISLFLFVFLWHVSSSSSSSCWFRGEHIRCTNLQFWCAYATLSHSATWIKLVCVFLSSSCCSMEFPKWDAHRNKYRLVREIQTWESRVYFVQQIWLPHISLY